jgi:deoxyribonuclease-4
MHYTQEFAKLHIGPSGRPVDAPVAGRTTGAMEGCLAHGWSTMEISFTNNIHIKEREAAEVAALQQQLAFPLSCHGSYFVNLASVEPAKIAQSKTRIIQGARRIQQCGGHSIVFHSAFYGSMEHEAVTQQVIAELNDVQAQMQEMGIDVWLRPELTGKPTQHGTPEELVEVCNAVEMALPCIDWSHMHARNNGGWNSYDEWCQLLELLGSGIKKNVLQRMHMHVSGILYGPLGEKKHIPLPESDLNYKELMKALRTFDVRGTLIVEAPDANQIGDVDMLIEAWESA